MITLFTSSTLLSDAKSEISDRILHNVFVEIENFQLEMIIMKTKRGIIITRIFAGDLFI